MNEIKDLIELYGIDISIVVFAIIGVIACIKHVIESLFEDYIMTKQKLKTIKYENEIQRSTMSYKILVERELKFYENYYDYASNLVTDIQDVNYNLKNQNLKRFKEYSLNVLECIPKIKKELLLNESYCDSGIRSEMTKLIQILQQDFGKIISNICAKTDFKDNEDNMDNVCSAVLTQLATISCLIQSREQIMSGICDDN